MRSAGDIVWRTLVVLAATAVGVWIVLDAYHGTWSAILIGAVLVAAGAIAARPWAALVPWLGAAGWLLYVFVRYGADLHEGRSDTTWAMWIAIAGTMAFVAMAGIAVGVAVGMRIADMRDRERPARSRHRLTAV